MNLSLFSVIIKKSADRLQRTESSLMYKEAMTMKRHLSFLATAAVTGLLTAALAVNALAAPITEEEAKSFALENAGTAAENVVFIRAEKDQEDGRNVFEVEFLTRENEEYDYEILADTGEILAISYEKKVPVTPKGKDGKEFTQKQAKEIALKHAGLAADAVTVIKEKADIDDGRLIYELEFYTGDYQKYEYEIDGRSGEILAWDFDADSAYARQDAQNRQTKADAGDRAGEKRPDGTSDEKRGFTQEDAKAAALRRAGLKEGQVIWGQVYKEHDDGRLIYKGEFFHNQTEYEFEMDAVSGEILDWDVESIDD